MAYELKWNSNHPGHIVFLIDLSGSMENKIDDVINAVQSTCKSLVAHCMSGTTLKERISISIYGYNFQVKELLPHTPSSIKDIAIALKNAYASNRPMFDKNKEAKPEYQTVMRLAFEKAKYDIEAWIEKQKRAERMSIPSPIVINITDGFPYEGEGTNQKSVYEQTLHAAQELMKTSTSDGNVRVYNIHFDPKTEKETLTFPQHRPKEEHLQFLFDASSPMSEDMVMSAQSYFKSANINSRCMISNETDVSNLAKFLEWGSTK